MSVIENLEKMLAAGKDGALLRFSLGNEYAKAKRHADAVEQLRMAVKIDPGYSAAWKLLGKSLTALGEHHEAVAVFDQGIAHAQAKGDMQAVKEMEVFRRRGEKAASAE